MASVWAELQRRNVVKVAVLYVVASWLILQVADVLLLNLGAPEWAFGFVLGLLILFFFPALIFAWVFEITPEGLKREFEIDRSQSITRETGRRLNLVTIAIVVAGAGLLLVDRFLLDRQVDAPRRSAIDDTTPIVAVLPFKATGSDDGGFLAAGLHDDLLTRLAKLDAFKVISRTSMMEYANTTKNMRQIGEELGAGYVLEGGVQALGDRVRVNAQLIDAPADEHIWADTYDRELDAANLFDIQAELAVAIAGQLQTTLSPSDRNVVGDVPTQSTAAYNAYLRGLQRHLAGTFNAENERAVVAAFEEAIEADPEFGQAWARLSIARTRLAQITMDAEIRQSALAALHRARALQPDLLETEVAWAVYLYRGLYEYEQAVEALEVIGEEASLNAESLTIKAWLYRRLGRFDDAYKALLAAEQLDPRSAAIIDSLVNAAILRDDCDAAGRHARNALSISPDLVDTRTQLAEYELECTGDAGRASELLRDVDYEHNWHLWVARNAALAERDYERALALSEMPAFQHERYPLIAISQQLYRSSALLLLGRDDESVATLDAVAESLVAAKTEGDYIGIESYAWVMASYNAMRGDTTATRDWVAEHKRRFRVERKGDRVEESTNHEGYARIFAVAGLHDEAIEELKVMFEEPGGRGFRYVDAQPSFDALKDHPDYAELRVRFGDAR
jgi:TolB-like protein/cytochrome c-type biogenesis protein CcmH/NrfG